MNFMKQFFTLFLLMLGTLVMRAQNPVTWAFSSKKIADKTYEVHMKAAIQPGWHLYSQSQPEDAIAIPTGFTLAANPLFTLDGKIREVGKLEKFHDKKLDISANQYSTTVDFVQVIKLKTNAKTSLTGNVEYQTCNDERCLPPKKVNFSIAIQ